MSGNDRLHRREQTAARGALSRGRLSPARMPPHPCRRPVVHCRVSRHSLRVVSSLGMPLLRRCVLTAGLALAFAPQLRAQLPTPDQARVLLQTRPDLVAQLRIAIAQSGLTPDQIRARLRAAGYPDDILDAYLPSGSSGSRGRSSVDDSLTTGLPGDDILDAMAALGLTDSADTSGLRAQARARTPRPGARRDSLGAGAASAGGPPAEAP